MSVAFVAFFYRVAELEGKSGPLWGLLSACASLGFYSSPGTAAGANAALFFAFTVFINLVPGPHRR